MSSRMMLWLFLLQVVLFNGAVFARDMIVGDDQLQIVLSYGNNGLQEKEFRLRGVKIADLSGLPWDLNTDQGSFASEGKVQMVQGSDAKKAIFTGRNSIFEWTTEYRLSGTGRITKSLSITPRQSITIQGVSMWSAKCASKPLVASTSLLDIAAFFREDKIGMFASLDFPYSKILSGDSKIEVTYPPFDKVEASQKYVCHSITFGVTELSGRVRYGFYQGEVDAMDSYVQERFEPRFNRPMFTSASVMNRYTQVEGGWIFYTMKDHPTLSFNIDILKREIALLQKLGIEDYQLFPGVFDWVQNDPCSAVVKDVMDYAREHNVRAGDYSGTSAVFCTHYNQYKNSLAGKNFAPCFGSKEFVDWYTNTVVSTCRKYGFEMHALDFLGIAQCQDVSHGHPLGDGSIYAQIRGLVGFAQAVNDVSPEMIIWPNSGNWTELLPKIAWYTPNLYLTDPFIVTPWPGLNMTRLLDDARREQMVNLHYQRFVPYRFFCNCQYFFCQNSIVPDIRKNYQYGALSTLAVTPNLCLAEVRPWIESCSPTEQEQILSFYSKWTKFIKDNYSLWTRTYHIEDDPRPDGVEVYSHAKGDSGFVFIVNPNYWSKEVEIPLDASMGFSATGKCELVELYPVERLRLVDQSPVVELGKTVKITAPAQEVVVLEVRPVPANGKELQLYGLPGSVEKTKDGYTVKTRGSQGTVAQFAIPIPNGSPAVTSVDFRKEIPEMDRRQWDWDPTRVKLVQSDSNIAIVEVNFRRKAPSSELRNWQVCPASLDEGLKSNWISGFSGGKQMRLPIFPKPGQDNSGFGAVANFRGAYIDNAFCEDQETWIYLKTGNEGQQKTATADFNDSPANVQIYKDPNSSNPVITGASKTWWYQTTFNLPFTYHFGMEPAFKDHTILVLPFAKNDSVGNVHVWINGAPVDVNVYHYPRNPALLCRWVDLIGVTQSGENKLVVFYEEK